MSTVTLGGDRLGSGNKSKIAMRNYERSTHDLSYTWRSSMSSGTLVPFINNVSLPGDTHEIKLDLDCMTLPTVGPLFGSCKIQADVFEIPLRLYNAKLHMNMLGIGMDMSEITLPQMQLNAKWSDEDPTATQVNKSSILSYLGISGLGRRKEGDTNDYVSRQFNAVSLLAYWDVYKNYFANKMEEKGAVISSQLQIIEYTISSAQYVEADGTITNLLGSGSHTVNPIGAEVTINFSNPTTIGKPDLETLSIDYGTFVPITQRFTNFDYVYTEEGAVQSVIASNSRLTSNTRNVGIEAGTTVKNTAGDGTYNPTPVVRTFDLSNIDEVRLEILRTTTQYQIGCLEDGSWIDLSMGNYAPYNRVLGAVGGGDDIIWRCTQPQEGLGLKTYQSDLFNNWIDTEFIEGENGVNAVSSVDTSGDSFTIDALNLANKVYNMLNRIALSGGSYDDWLDAVYTHERSKSIESPVYHGSLIKELGFEEVIASTEAEGQPLGQLGGRGRLTQKNKGGYIKIKTNEPSIILGLVSITPKVDYSQGNQWHMNLKTMDDFHKPALDQIGYQDLITEQMLYLDTSISDDGSIVYRSAGKVPAWINYMTDVNRTYGNFADENKEMFMTFNRRYEYNDEAGELGIKDLTTYIDPTKINQVFADTNLDAQNFWMQIGVKWEARRKMSAKVIPNL